MYYMINNMGQMPPCDHFRVGFQNDGSGQYYSVIANTPYGRIPGKGVAGRAWYAYGGDEIETSDFEFLKCAPGCHVVLERSSFPPHGVITGYQNDSGVYFAVVCHSPHGNIPGKSNGRSSWYSWGSKENETSDFSYVVVRGYKNSNLEKQGHHYHMIENLGQIPPSDDFRVGFQNDGSGNYYCVMANTPYGLIPAKAQQDKAWYPYAGAENQTSDFHFLRTHHGAHVVLEKSWSGPPRGAVTGHQYDSGTVFAVVCHSPHGNIPGKSNGRSSWYSWGGKENETSDFSYVVVKGRH